MSKPNKRKQTYHCISQKSNTHAICGLDIFTNDEYIIWDYPKDFMDNKAGAFYSPYTKCKECLDHEDLPLLVLGEIDKPSTRYGQITVNNKGAFAMGTATTGGTITSTGMGSFMHGYKGLD